MPLKSHPYILRKFSQEVLSSRIGVLINIAHENIEDEYWQKEHFLTPLKHKWDLSFYLTSSDDDNILGYIIASEKIDTVHIHKFVISENYQRKGLGRMMFEHFLSLSKGPISLKVSPTNLYAITFYKKLGFSIVESTGQNLSMVYYR